MSWVIKQRITSSPWVQKLGASPRFAKKLYQEIYTDVKKNCSALLNGSY